jgi:hypothetical protein
MNCAEFEVCIRDVAVEQDIESFRRTEALQHANACSRCAVRLSEERALAAGLQVLAAAARRETGSPDLEEALLRNFRRLERPKAPLLDPKLGLQSSETARGRTPAYVGLAASLLLLLGWSLIQFTRAPRMDQAQISPAPESKPPLPEKSAPSKATPESTSEPVRKPSRPVRTRQPRISTPVAEGRVQYATRSSRETGSREAESNANDRVETEFLPFMAAGPRFPSEQRQFVRVKLPRSALQVFGLPMNMERAREPVQADVLLGEDGRALAVRFVRD